MRARLKRALWFQPVTSISTLVAVLSLAYLLAQGASDRSLVRAAAGGWLLLVVGFSAAVRAYYAEANKRVRDPDRGALPRHVGQISTSYMLALVFIVIELWNRAGQPLSWRIPLAVLIGVQGIRGLLALIEFERRRVYVISPYITDLRGSPHDERRSAQ